MLLCTLGASLLENTSAGERVIRSYDELFEKVEK